MSEPEQNESRPRAGIPIRWRKPDGTTYHLGTYTPQEWGDIRRDRLLTLPDVSAEYAAKIRLGYHLSVRA